jgi:hypothetical protein
MKMTHFVVRKALLGGAIVCLLPVSAQWITYPSKATPRGTDGKVNLKAPAPRLADGKPDFAGVWQVDSPRHFSNIAADYKRDEEPLQPWAKQLLKERRDTLGKTDPNARCIPVGIPKVVPAPNTPFRIVQTLDRTIILYERNTMFRQIFTDGRPLPVDPQPTFMGYSIGKWEGDTFVVETSGFNDVSWLDDDGHPHTTAMHVTERMRRPDFGTLEIVITINDPKALTAPLTARVPYHILPDGELMEYFCEENEKDFGHLVGR